MQKLCCNPSQEMAVATSNARSTIESKVSCVNCGAFAKDYAKCRPKTGCIAQTQQSLCNVCPTHGNRLHVDENRVSIGVGQKIVSALRQTFGFRKAHKEPARCLQEILGELQSLNGWLTSRVKCNETDYSYFKDMLELEEHRLEKNCGALIESQQSLNVLCNQADYKKQDISGTLGEIGHLEADIKRHEPALYQRYQALQRMPGNRDVIMNTIRTSITNKQAALKKMDVLLSLSQLNLTTIDEQSNENPVMMILPTKMPALSFPQQTVRQSESPMKRLHFVYPIGTAAKQEDSHGHGHA